jgi:hypothetical protein
METGRLGSRRIQEACRGIVLGNTFQAKKPAGLCRTKGKAAATKAKPATNVRACQECLPGMACHAPTARGKSEGAAMGGQVASGEMKKRLASPSFVGVREAAATKAKPATNVRACQECLPGMACHAPTNPWAIPVPSRRIKKPPPRRHSGAKHGRPISSRGSSGGRSGSAWWRPPRPTRKCLAAKDERRRA